jgi:hypothetical protein
MYYSGQKCWRLVQVALTPEQKEAWEREKAERKPGENKNRNRPGLKKRKRKKDHRGGKQSRRAGFQGPSDILCSRPGGKCGCCFPGTVDSVTYLAIKFVDSRTGSYFKINVEIGSLNNQNYYKNFTLRA